MTTKPFQFGEWRVDPATCTLSCDDTTTQIEPRAMDVLVALCQRAGDVLSAEELLNQCWPGIVVGENQVHKAITQLRRALGDTATNAVYIQNIRKRGYRTAAEVIRVEGGDSPVNAMGWAQGSPYVGLDAFDASRSSVFFGRDAALAELFRATVAQVQAGVGFMLLLGASGSGKTSLIRAGLLPSLASTKASLRALAIAELDLGDIGDMPLMTALGSTLLDLDTDGEPLLPDQSAEGIGRDLVSAPGHIHAQLQRAVQDQAQSRVVVFIDRLEALFDEAAFNRAARHDFLAALDSLARNGATLIVAACRNDFYPEVANEPVLMACKATGGHFDLLPPTPAEISLMIRLPAVAAGLSFGADPHSRARLDDVLREAASQSPDALPLLQYTLHELYLQRSTAGEMTMAAYEALGGLGGAIGRRAEAALAALQPDAQAALPRILSVLVTLGGNDENARSHRAPWAALRSDDERALVQTLVEHRLFVSLVYDKVPVFGIAHEALLRRWSRVADWIATHRQALNLRDRLASHASRWQQGGCSGDLLLPPGRQLAEAIDVRDDGLLTLDAPTLDLIEASQHRSRRAAWLRRGALASILSLAVAASILGWRANRAESLAQRKRSEAEELMGFMVGDFADKLKPIGRLDMLDSVGKKALFYLSAEDSTTAPPASRLQQAKALLTLAEVSRARANQAAATQALNRAGALLEANRRDGPIDNDLLKTLGAVSFWLGQMALDQGHGDEAERHFRHYLADAEEMNKRQPNDVDAWVELSYARSSLASLLLDHGHAAEAASEFAASVELKEKALALRPNDRNLRAQLANSLSWVGSAQAAQGELHSALRYYDKELAVLDRIHRQAPSEANWQDKIVWSHRRRAVIFEALGDMANAEAELNAAKQQAAELVLLEPSNQKWRFTQFVLQAALARVRADISPTASLTPLVDAIDEEKKMMQASAGNSSWRSEAIDASTLGAASFLARHDMPAARRLLDQADALAQAPGKPSRSDIKQNARLLLVRAGLDLAEGRTESANAGCQKAIDLLRDKVRSSTDYRILDLWVHAHVCAGQKAQAADALAWLNRIGYRRPAYLSLVSHP